MKANDRRYADFERKARRVAPKTITQFTPTSSKLTKQIAGYFEDSFGHAPEPVRVKYLEKFLKRNYSLGPDDVLSPVVCLVAIDPWLDGMTSPLVTKADPKDVKKLLGVYLRLSQALPELESDGIPCSKGNEAGKRWARVEKIFQSLDGFERWKLFDWLIRRSKRLKVKDHWMLRDLSQHLELGRAQPLAEAVWNSYDPDGSSGPNLELMKALAFVAQNKAMGAMRYH